VTPRRELPAELLEAIAVAEAELTEEFQRLGYDGVRVVWDDDDVHEREDQP